MVDLTDMTLAINVTVGGTIDPSVPFKPTVTYVQAGSVPDSPNVVDPQGNVNLPGMAYDPTKYTPDTDISFNLFGTIYGPNNEPVNFSFPSNLSQAITVTLNGQPAPNIAALAGNSPMQVILDDDDGSGQTYSYALSILMAWPDSNGTLVQLDPSIVNR